MHSHDADSLVSTRQARAELGQIANSTLWDWVKRGLLPQPHHIRQRAFWKRGDFNAAKARLIEPPRAS